MALFVNTGKPLLDSHKAWVRGQQPLTPVNIHHVTVHGATYATKNSQVVDCFYLKNYLESQFRLQLYFCEILLNVFVSI